ncbi:MAG: CHASE3 domain-containing protein [Cytophagales bacterium]|nr:CHASE3 domain-containing protein [Cytophagales bacterium]
MKHKAVDILFLGSFLFIGVILFTVYNYYNRLSRYNDLVDHTYQVKNTIIDLESEYRSMVANQRTFLLTQSSSYRAKYELGQKNARELSGLLGKLIHDNPVQVRNLDSLNRSFENRVSQLNEEIMMLEKGLITDRSIRNHVVATSNEVESFMSEIKEMNAHETMLLKGRLERQTQGERMTPIAFIILGVVSISILAYSYFRLKTELADNTELLSSKRVMLRKLLNFNNELEHYVYLTSHNLQEPLRKIQLFTDTAMIAFKRNEVNKVEGYLKSIDNAAKESAEMVKGLQNQAKMNIEGAQKNFVHLSDLFKEVASEFQVALEPDVKVRIESDETPKMYVHRDQITDLFRKLIENSVKFRNQELPEVVLSLVYERKEVMGVEYHSVKVKDNGLGFDTRYAEKIFMIFNKLGLHKNSNSKPVGLSVCKKIMERHDGFIEAHSEVGKGATFECLFPLIG